MNVEEIAAADPDLILILLPFDQIDGAEQFDELARWEQQAAVTPDEYGTIEVDNHGEFGGAVAACEVIADITEALRAYQARA